MIDYSENLRLKIPEQSGGKHLWKSNNLYLHKLELSLFKNLKPFSD